MGDHCPEPEASDALEHRLAIVLTSGLMIMAVKLLLDIPIREWKYCAMFNEAGTTLIIGMIVGLFNWGVGAVSGHQLVEIVPETYAEVFSLILLPPIIFGAGFTLKSKHFMNNLGAILLYAVLGTVLVAVVIASGMWLMLQTGWITGLSKEDPVEAMLYGAALSATDTVAIVAVFQELNIDPLVYTLVFGESVLNDAVAIVLFRTFRDYIGKPIFNPSAFFGIIALFTWTFFGSCLAGALIAAISAAILKKLHHYFAAPHETIWMIVFAFASYLIAELAGLSGILSVFVCSVMMSHYHWYTLSKDAQITMLTFSSAVGGLCDSLVFLSIGMFVFRVEIHYAAWDPRFLFATIFLSFLARAVEIFPFSAGLNLTRVGENRIQLKHQVMMWFAGMRGAVALVLALIVSADLGENPLVVNAILFIVLFSNLIMGPLTKPLTHWLHIKVGKHGENLNMRGMEEEPDQDIELEMQATEGLVEASPMAGMIKAERKVRSRFAQFFKNLDTKWIKPYLGGKPSKEQIEQGEAVERPSRDMMLQQLNRTQSERASMSIERFREGRLDRSSLERPSLDRSGAHHNVSLNDE
eukprot:TRINITY_DN23046_c0_g1_i1.p1 TRINITY_DN23046_c0_g1~~TRINITY_DN23046_c0_g1_i1.p1  ORF type:complete len:601 (-),score=105.89 TRINITY_DN23046_c0_g1_i1:181-1926(-)